MRGDLLQSSGGELPLRLRVSRYDGAPRSPAEIRRVFAGDAVLSWEPHPVTGELFCLVHGCLDGDAGDDASLLAWFSRTARLLGLRVPPEKWRALRDAWERGVAGGGDDGA